MLIFEYLRFLMPTKNALIFVGNSIPNLKTNKRKARYEILKAVAKIMLFQRINDLNILKNISYTDIEKLLDKNYAYNKAFLNNFKLLLEYYPENNKFLKEILHYKTTNILDKMYEIYLKDTNTNVLYFQNVLIIIVIIISVLFFVLLVLVYKLELNLDKVTFLAEHDLLTGLKNRIRFEEDIKKLNSPSIVLFDIDKFKNLNDYFGSEIGDEILKYISNELKNFINIVHYKLDVYRFGSDEFGLVGDGIDEITLQTLADEFIKVAENKIIKRENIDISVTLSAGISTKAPILENADIALKQAKNDIKKKVVVFNDNLNKNIEDNLKKAQEIKNAINSNGIIPYFQGIFDKDKNIYKYEVLCRVKVGNEIKSIFPYLEIVKENKMYHRVTMIILEKSLKILKDYDINLSINLSLEDILDEDIKDFIFENFTDKNIARKVTFEILESEIGSYEELEFFIRALKSYGVTFAIDDFGSGYSNFARILKLNVDYIKIDGSIIKNIDKDATSRSVLKTIVNFAKENSLHTVAEFIHNEEVFNISKNMGVEYFQGFYLAEPLPFEKLKV
jgi:diguanylate cyclase (GGDEF)-like protein